MYCMELKKNLLYVILQNPNTPNKYSKSFLNLLNVVELEKLDESFDLPKDFMLKYNKVKLRYDNFINNIPLIVIERYFESNRDNFNKYVFLEFKENEITDVKVSEIFLQLETFFKDVFNLAVMIASYYNLEIKLNKGNLTDTVKDYI